MLWMAATLAVCLSATASENAAPPLRKSSPFHAYCKTVEQAAHNRKNVEQGNHVCIVNEGYDALAVRVHLIRAATESIRIQTFILADDECARLIMTELIEAAKRGVHVQLLADHFMSARDEKWVATLSTASPNLELRYYRPPAERISPSKAREFLNGLLLSRAANQRMHNKVMIIDGCVALLGGRNIDNHYYNHSLTYNFIDRDALVMGPVVPGIVESFYKYWEWRKSIPSTELKDVERTIASGKYPPYQGPGSFDYNGFFDDIQRDAEDPAYIKNQFIDQFIVAKKIAFIADLPGKNSQMAFWGSGRHTRMLRKIISNTDESLIMQSPYLILSASGKRVYRKLRKRSPDALVIISTNSFASTDNTLAYSANFKLRSTYVKGLDFHIYEYRPHPADLLEHLPNFPDLERRAREADDGGRGPFLSIHAKSFVVDDKIAYVGSYNMDPRSDNLNTEVGIVIEDERVAKIIKDRILNCTRPDTSWVIAERKIPLDDVNYLFEGISGLTPIDIWPLRNTGSFELIDGKQPLPPDDPHFHDNYVDVGNFPGAEGISAKAIGIHIYKMLNTLAIPML